MHQKIFDLIGEDRSGLSSDFNRNPSIFPPSIDQKHLQIQTLNRSTSQSKNHLRIQIPSLSSLRFPSSKQSDPSTTTHQNPKQTQFQNEPICNTTSTNETLPSTSHKRPLMSRTISTLCSSSFGVALACRTIALRLFRHFYSVRWLRVHLRVFIILSLPSLYFLTSTHHSIFLLDFLPVFAFSAALVISLNLALPRLPSIRLFLARTFPTKLSSTTTASKSHLPVVWLIGSKAKSEKRVNSGSWVQVYRNGDVYEGEFHKGNCSGSGVYYYHMSGRYEGDWVDERYDGYGVETWAKGSRYRGQYRQGLRHGAGVYRFYFGDVYAGEWCNGQCHGRGVHTCRDGSCYVGEFKWGVKHGLGHYHFRNGDTYAGEYFADKMHGFGVYRFGNGHQYEGAWHEGRRQGLGMYTFRNGDIQSGHWQNGVINVLSTQSTHPGSPFTINHSKVLNAVQEAQRAAQKAYNVERVDERVSKAVAAANKAANAARVAAVKAVQNQMHHRNNSDDASNPTV
ncbi:uncharacterized protein LOC132304144 [Cornus florida]|uniref:uncharacterized protein LOC132304144 n=1 Tax=Cornus florida TaxID=4283 RepID=UPI00289A9A65|nr:uncharacterized protein LOC132304144 [Cornus florida]